MHSVGIVIAVIIKLHTFMKLSLLSHVNHNEWNNFIQLAIPQGNLILPHRPFRLLRRPMII